MFVYLTLLPTSTFPSYFFSIFNAHVTATRSIMVEGKRPPMKL